MRCRKSSSKREVYSNTILLQETRKTSNRQPNFTPKATGKRRKKNKISKRKEIIKSQTNENEMKETIVKINKTKSWFFEKINKIDKPLARFIKKKREKNQINKIRNEEGEVTKRQCRNTMDYKTITNNYMAIKWTTWKKWTDSQKSSILQD